MAKDSPRLPYVVRLVARLELEGKTVTPTLKAEAQAAYAKWKAQIDAEELD